MIDQYHYDFLAYLILYWQEEVERRMQRLRWRVDRYDWERGKVVCRYRWPAQGPQP